MTNSATKTYRRTRLKSNHSRQTANGLSAQSGDLALGAISRNELLPLFEKWLRAGELQLHSPRTIEARRNFIGKLLWFLKEKEHSHVGPEELSEFFRYLSQGHKEVGGRWGKAHLTKAVRPITVKDYHTHLNGFFQWLVFAGHLEHNPMETIQAPVCPKEQKQPLSEEEVKRMFEATDVLKYPARDRLILTLLFDTGIRASELINLKLRDVDLEAQKLSVLGKGSKFRTVPFGEQSLEALQLYLAGRDDEPEAPVFQSDRKSRGLSRSGLTQLLERLAKAAGIKQKAGPHAFRRTFAVNWIRGGGNMLTLQMILGHTHLEMTRQYVALAHADVENEHRKFSPADRLRATSSLPSSRDRHTPQTRDACRLSHQAQHPSRTRRSRRR